MSGKAIILLVTGVIIISSMIMYNVEASSTRIVKNFTDYYMRQNTQNIAQSGVNLARAQLGIDRNWRAGFSNLKLVDGVVNVTVDTTRFDGVPVIRVKSIAESDYGNKHYRRDTSTAYLFYSIKQHPVTVRGLLTANASVSFGGNSIIDGRDHKLDGTVIPGTGVPAVWSTSPTFSIGPASAKAGGTDDLHVDYAPSNPADPSVVKLSQVDPDGFPQTPDSVFGGAKNTFPEGTLLAMAKTGYAGSQYVTDPTKLKQPITGVTYIELPSGGIWDSPVFSGSGILIIHNKAKNAKLLNGQGTFKGLIISDDVVHLHGTILGGIVAMKSILSGNAIGNGGSFLLYSRDAIIQASKFLDDFGKPAVLAWWE
jgi:hypothetical protein